MEHAAQLGSIAGANHRSTKKCRPQREQRKGRKSQRRSLSRSFRSPTPLTSTDRQCGHRDENIPYPTAFRLKLLLFSLAVLGVRAIPIHQGNLTASYLACRSYERRMAASSRVMTSGPDEVFPSFRSNRLAALSDRFWARAISFCRFLNVVCDRAAIGPHFFAHWSSFGW